MRVNTTLTIGALLLAVSTFAACGGSNSASPVSPSLTTDTKPTQPTTPTVPSTVPPPAPPQTPTAADIVITISGMNDAQSYSPAIGSVAVGQTVSWKNADNLPHTATANGGSFDTGTIAPGATSAPIAMGTAGSFAYHCAIHPSMTGSLTVTASSGPTGPGY